MCDGACMRSFHISEDGGCNALQIPEASATLFSACNAALLTAHNCSMVRMHQFSSKLADLSTTVHG